MKFQTFEEKKVYFAKVRRRNYAASLRLEGLGTTTAEQKPSGMTSRPSWQVKV